MKAMILAGGMSTRLYPLTKQVPKPLVPIAGEPNAAHLMRYLHSFGIDEIAINVHYLADKIVEALGDGSRYGVKLHYLHEAKLMGSAGGVKQVADFLRGDTFVVIGCDEVTDMALDALLATHHRTRAEATIALVRAEDVSQYGVVILEEDGRIVDFQEKPKAGTERSKLVNTGVYVFEPSVLDRIPADTFYDFGNDVFPQLRREHANFYGMEMAGAYWRDIGNPVEYRNATNDVLAGVVKLVGSSQANGHATDATIASDATFEGDVHVGSGAVIEAAARLVGPSVIGDRVVVGARARIERSIVWHDSRIGADASLADSIVGIDYAVADGERLEGRVVANEPATV